MDNLVETATIVIVDDEELILTSLSTFLNLETSYRTVTFTSVQPALQYIQDHEVALVDHLRHFEGLADNHARGLATEILVQRTAVDRDVAAAGRQKHSSCRGFTSSGTVFSLRCHYYSIKALGFQVAAPSGDASPRRTP